MARSRSDLAGGLEARDVAALAALRRLSFGAAHSLNNAFSAALGEANYLLEERTKDAELVECCQVIVESLERSTRITRALLGHRHALAVEDETDLGRLLTELVACLRETLGSGHPLSIELPDEWIAVKGDPSDVDLVLTTLFQYAADASGDQARLDAVLEKRDGVARLTLQIIARELPDRDAESVVEAVNDPSLASDAITRTCLAAARELVATLGGTLHARSTAPDTWALALVLPTT